MFIQGELMKMLMVKTTISETHLLDDAIELLMPLMDEGVYIGQCLRVSALVVLSTGVLDLLAVMQLQPRKDLLGV